MKKYILRIIIFLIIGYGIGEVIVRAFKLTSDIPQRYLDANGIQLYKTGQKGYFRGAEKPWEVNSYGWVGIADIETKSKRVSIIGDSYIENMLNPIDCNQAAYLKQMHNDIGFFEAGRSGVTFIEAMEIAKHLDSLNIDQNLIYINENDFYESLSSIERYTDRMQVNLETNTILKGELKSPGLKKILYNAKFLYYLYLRFPLFVSKQNKGEEIEVSDRFNSTDFNKLFQFCNERYDLDRMTFVFHPNTSEKIIAFFKANNVKCLALQFTGNQTWDINENDAHWSCYGHKEVANQVSNYLSELKIE